jgi:predicted RNA binding protein YcfA (HicA-like mRNA interferase family)
MSAGSWRLSPKLPRVTAPELLRALHRDGWEDARQEGSHIQLRHPTKPGRVTIAHHRRDVLNPRTLSVILEQAGLTVEALRELL